MLFPVENHLLTRSCVFVSPHYDDAVLSCGGVLTYLNEQGYACEVLTVFGGGPSWGDPLSSIARQYVGEDLASSEADISIEMCRDLVERRRREDRSACQRLGITNVHALSFKDAIYRCQGTMPYYVGEVDLFGPPAINDQQLLDTQLMEYFLCFKRESAISWFFPTLSPHVDHQILHQIGKKLQHRGFSIIFYEEFPYWKDAACFSLEGHTLHSVSIVQQLEAKIKAVLEYRSQIMCLFGGWDQVQQALAEERFLPDMERYWSKSLLHQDA